MIRVFLLLLFLAGCAEGHAGFGGTASSASGGYSYDDVGNRLTRSTSGFAPGTLDNQSFAFDPNDRLNTDTYDANGNTLLGAGFNQTQADRYDFENRLIERRSTVASVTRTVNLAYDGDGQRVSKTPSFHGHDGQGSVRFLTDTNGVVTDTFDYDAFGNLIARSGTTPNLYLHRGEQFDPDLNLYYLRARYHNPATGRFWTQDSFEGFATDPASLHHYTFNQNDPVNRIDPSGHFSVSEGMMTTTLAPMVRGTLQTLWDGINNFSYGLSGGNALKFTSREEAFFIDSLAVGPGWQFGKENFWAAAKGAPFLLVQNPNIWQSLKPCGYECIPFDLDAPVYGPTAAHPIFELDANPFGTWLNTDNSAFWQDQYQAAFPVRPGVYTDSLVGNLVRNIGRDAHAYGEQLNKHLGHFIVHGVQDATRLGAALAFQPRETLALVGQQLKKAGSAVWDSYMMGKLGDDVLNLGVAAYTKLSQVDRTSAEGLGDFVGSIEEVLLSLAGPKGLKLPAGAGALTKAPAKALAAEAKICSRGVGSKLGDLFRRFPRLNPANYQYDFSRLNTGPGAFVPKYVAPAAKGIPRVTEKGLARVEAHLDDVLKNQFPEFSRADQLRFQAGERGMLDRLRSGATTSQDIEFYMHELKESARFRATGNLLDSHNAALQWRGVTSQNLFHPEVIRANPEVFPPSWQP